MKNATAMALVIAAHVAYMVLVPLVVFGGAGLLADRYLGTLPRFLLLGIVVAFAVTIYWLTKQLKTVIELVRKGQ